MLAGYILIKETISVKITAVTYTAANNNDKDVILKNCTPFTDYVSKINNTQIENAKDIDVLIPIHNLTEYRDNYIEIIIQKHLEGYSNTIHMNHL